MDLVCKEDANRKANFTIWNGATEVASCETPEEVLGYVRKHPDHRYTIYLGNHIGLNSPEVDDLRRKWRK